MLIDFIFLFKRFKISLVISRFSSANSKLFLSTTILIFFSCIYSLIIGFKFFNNVPLAFDLWSATSCKSLFLSFCKLETLFLKFSTLDLYSSGLINFFCSIIFFSCSCMFFSLFFIFLNPLSNLFLKHLELFYLQHFHSKYI